MEKENFYKNFINLLSGLQMEKGITELYKKTDVFLQKYLNSSPLSVCSLSKRRKVINDRSFYLRRIYNKSLVFSKDLSDFMGMVEVEDFDENKWIIDKNFYCFFLAEDDHQIYLGFGEFLKGNNISWSFLELFSQSLNKFFLKVQKIEKIVEQNTLINVDDVTGLFNQRKLNNDLDKWIERYYSFGDKFAVLFIDIDHFKNVNDGHGHLVGTQILADLGNVLKGVLRKQDHLYRYGGDEFVLIIPGVDKKMACVIGERILKTVKNREFKIDETGELFKITVSIGIAIFPDNGKSRHDILALADQMMYLAKSSGRGQVKMALEILERR
ncbi:GGDEF domain-containing protein [Bacteriovoracales bacterium]|nr:GGDEF domain-containing protein [Bacteriovoracales bacterium]